MCEYVMYLRKSRADNPDESVEEVLQKHYTILQEYCEREFGFRIPEENIYREVVSGESIDERIEIKKVMSIVEDDRIKGVIVVEPQRLTRGDLVDCGRLIDTLRYSHTKVITPIMRYDLENKMERRFFQDELMRGRDYLEYVKEILMRGRTAAAKSGKFCYSTAPFGYDKCKIGKDYTLSVNKDADTVRMIFSMYDSGDTPHKIRNELHRLGINSPTGLEWWSIQTINKILKNYHYIGKITFQRRVNTVVIEDGKKRVSRISQKDGFIIAEGKHPPIIDEDMFYRVQERYGTHAPAPYNKQFRNMFSGMIFCDKCGSAMQFKSRNGGRKIDYYVCNTVGCSKSVKTDYIEETVISALETVELPKLEAICKSGNSESANVKKARIESLEKELYGYRCQEEKQYDLLETGTYTQDVFNRRNKAIREKIEQCSKQIEDVRKTMPDNVDYREKVITLQEAITSLKDDKITKERKNQLLRTIIDRIGITSNFTDKNGEYDVSIKLELKL